MNLLSLDKENKIMNEAEKKQNEYINQTAERVENRYDFKKAEKDAYRLKKGLTPEIVEELSAKKNDPEWMREFRLRSLEIYHSLDVPPWGPSIDDLNIDNIVTYVKPNTDMQGSWKNVPEDIKDTFDKLGIPQAEQKSLARLSQSQRRSCQTRRNLYRYRNCSQRPL